MDNMRKGRPSKAKQDRLIENFVAGPTTRRAAVLVGINHSKLFADRQNHINGIVNFWNQAKRHFGIQWCSQRAFPAIFKEV